MHQHEDSSFTARVRVDGRLLRPDCVACSRVATLAYVEAALVDARHADRLVVRVQGAGGIREFSTTRASEVMHWLASEVPVAACRDAKPEGAQSGTRPIVGPTLAEPKAKPKAS